MGGDRGPHNACEPKGALDLKVGAGKPAQNFAQLTQQAAHCCQAIIKYSSPFHMAAVCAPGFEPSVFE